MRNRLPSTMAVIALTLWMSAVGFSADKRETGRIDGDRYVDSQYGFSLRRLENWKYGKPEKEDAAKPLRIRMNLTQQNYPIPPDRRASPESYTAPTVTVWVDTSGLTVDAFAAELNDRRSKAKWRKELVAQFSVLEKGALEQQGKIQIDGRGGLLHQYREDYRTEIYDRNRDRYTIVQDFVLGDLFMVSYKGRMYMVLFRAEHSNYRQVKDEARNMILTLDLDPPADTTAAAP